MLLIIFTLLLLSLIYIRGKKVYRSMIVSDVLMIGICLMINYSFIINLSFDKLNLWLLIFYNIVILILDLAQLLSMASYRDPLYITLKKTKLNINKFFTPVISTVLIVLLETVSFYFMNYYLFIFVNIILGYLCYIRFNSIKYYKNFLNELMGLTEKSKQYSVLLIALFQALFFISIFISRKYNFWNLNEELTCVLITLVLSSINVIFIARIVFLMVKEFYQDDMVDQSVNRDNFIWVDKGLNKINLKSIKVTIKNLISKSPTKNKEMFFRLGSIVLFMMIFQYYLVLILNVTSVSFFLKIHETIFDCFISYLNVIVMGLSSNGEINYSGIIVNFESISKIIVYLLNKALELVLIPILIVFFLEYLKMNNKLRNKTLNMAEQIRINNLRHHHQSNLDLWIEGKIDDYSLYSAITELLNSMYYLTENQQENKEYVNDEIVKLSEYLETVILCSEDISNKGQLYHHLGYIAEKVIKNPVKAIANYELAIANDYSSSANQIGLIKKEQFYKKIGYEDYMKLLDENKTLYKEIFDNLNLAIKAGNVKAYKNQADMISLYTQYFIEKNDIKKHKENLSKVYKYYKNYALFTLRSGDLNLEKEARIAKIEAFIAKVKLFNIEVTHTKNTNDRLKFAREIMNEYEDLLKIYFNNRRKDTDMIRLKDSFYTFYLHNLEIFDKIRNRDIFFMDMMLYINEFISLFDNKNLYSKIKLIQFYDNMCFIVNHNVFDLYDSIEIYQSIAELNDDFKMIKCLDHETICKMASKCRDFNIVDTINAIHEYSF